MFERFTERARQVVVLAQEEARVLKHNYIGTEHILLGLLREEESLAARVLRSFDVTVESARALVVRIVGSGEEVTSGHIPFTPGAKKVLEYALREALSHAHDDIATYHILLGLLRQKDGVGARVLRDLAVDGQEARDRVLAELGNAPDEGPRGLADSPAHEPPWQNRRFDEVLGRLRQQGASEPSAPVAKSGMFERFTERARQVVVLAQEEASEIRYAQAYPSAVTRAIANPS